MLTFVRNALAGIALVMMAAPAAAVTINLEPPDSADLGYVYSQDGYTFTNSSGSSGAYFNWKAIGGAPVYDADYPGSTLDQNFYDTTNTITKTGGGSFLFGGISLAEVHNEVFGGNVVFTFNYADGTSASDTVMLANRIGLQAFAFNQANVLSVDIATNPMKSTDARALQFDYLVANSTAVGQVPLPASLPLFGAALLTLTGLGYGLQRRASRGTTAATTA